MYGLFILNRFSACCVRASKVVFCSRTMTSTNFNVGMGDARNSSRVLKPPGGGHTDIFGIYQPQDQQTPRTKHKHPKSSIGDVFSTAGAPINNTSSQKSEEEQPEAEPEPQPTVTEDAAPKPTVPTPQRARIPPGGFSSGLW